MSRIVIAGSSAYDVDASSASRRLPSPTRPPLVDPAERTHLCAGIAIGGGTATIGSDPGDADAGSTAPPVASASGLAGVGVGEGDANFDSSLATAGTICFDVRLGAGDRAPTGADLTDVPQETIGLLVHQAAMKARSNAKQEDPVSTICNWMENFCTAYAGKEEERECDDQWYRMAMEAFGYVTPRTMPGEQPQLPANSAFGKDGRGWRSLFHALCNAYGGTWQTSRFEFKGFWKFFRTWWPELPVLPNEFLNIDSIFDLTLTQREKDDLLLVLLQAGVMMHLEEEKLKKPTDEGEKAEPTDDPLREDWTDECEKLLVQLSRSYTSWVKGEAPVQTNDDFILEELTTPWMAVVTLLRLRGARVWDEKTNRILYETYDVQDQWLQEALTLGPLRGQTARPMARDALRKGANPNLKIFYGKPTTVLLMAVEEESQILDTMLDEGARIRTRMEASRIFGALLYRAAGPRYTTEAPVNWPISPSALKRLIAMLAPYLTPKEKIQAHDQLIRNGINYPSEIAKAWRDVIKRVTD